jgi:predicted nucleotidyltransferase
MTTQELHKVDLEYVRRILIDHSSIDAAALYGSVARGDAESHSDVDLLLICRTSRKLPAFLDVQRALDGYFHRLSITVYSERELKFLHSVRSLFLLHLSREAILLFDKNDFLDSLLKNFKPKSSYRADFEKSLTLLDPLKAAIRDAPNNFHRLSYIYSLFRVFGVYLLAENGIYEFSKSRMARLLVEAFPEQGETVERLSKLRSLNSNFFTGGRAEEQHLTESAFFEQTGALASLVRVEMSVISSSYETAVLLFDEAVGQTNRALDYRLRMWFLLLVYDGLNLYRSRVGIEPLTNLSESALRGIVHSTDPESIRCAAEETVRYLRRYPLKYFLSEEARINAQSAQTILHKLDDELRQ